MSKATTAPNIVTATGEYEQWLAKQLHIVSADLKAKHTAMATDPFSFMRATFYRWAQLFPELCPDLASAPTVLAIGDLHVENFGTWHDALGQLVWGINDVDEAYVIPYTNDLVRLAASTRLAISQGKLGLHEHPACDAIIEGYQDALHKGGAPFVLGGPHHHFLSRYATAATRPAQSFWHALSALPVVSPKPGDPDAPAEAVLRSTLPHGTHHVTLHARRAGLGSLGRVRLVALADSADGPTAREAKARAESAWVWATGKPGVATDEEKALLDHAVRERDPAMHFDAHWTVRELAPYSTRIELAKLDAKDDELKLLKSMGFETGNVHLATRDMAATIIADSAGRPDGWLHDASKVMTEAILADHRVWADSQR